MIFRFRSTNAQRLFYAAAVLTSWLSITVIAAISLLGFPRKDEPWQDASKNVCFLARELYDRHLPCPDDTAAQTGKRTDREALWSLIHSVCVPISYFGLSYPCLSVNRREGYVLIRSPIRGMIDVLVSPTTKIQGLESKELLSTEAPNIWLSAWKERSRLNALSSRQLSPTQIMMAVNSKATRSQDQLHLHLGCVRRGVREFFQSQTIPETQTWIPVHIDAVNANFFMKALPADGLKQNAFKIVSNELPDGIRSGEKQLVAVVGSETRSFNGFFLLVSFDPISAESLMDNLCQE
jgi:CDP-diacylglycerol pyrophosphatase